MREIDNPTASLTISKLMNSYTHNIDTNDLDGVLELLEDDASLDFGVHEGKEEVREYFTGFSAARRGFSTLSTMLNPQMTVDGDTASGTWNLFGLMEVEGIRAAWLVGYYTAEFTKEGDERLISDLVYDAKYFSSYDEGWAEEPMAM